MGKSCHSNDSEGERYIELCIAAIRESGARVTKARKAVARCLARYRQPLSPQQLYDRVCEDESAGTLDKVSVYRILDTFHELGLVHRVSPHGRYIACMHLECEGVFHVIRTCRKCLRTEEIHVPMEIVVPLVSHLRDVKGFTADTHCFHAEGVCATCQKMAES